MVIDIRKDVPEFEKYVARRVSEHVAALKKHKKPKAVARIDFGFEFGQANWVALVFDTRKDAEPDGEWSRGINKILLERPAAARTGPTTPASSSLTSRARRSMS